MSSATDFDERMIRRAMRLAMNGRGRVEPNPMVGCVIVKDGRIIGEGWHRAFGGAHAEPTALANCSESPAGATAYVTLEPCCHANKKTPPCAPRLIAAHVARVVVGCLDPNPAVDGKGLTMLRGAGIDVSAPVLEAEAKQLVAPFIARTRLGRPYVTAKWAQTADAKAGAARGPRLLISGEEANHAVHRLRSRCDAVVVGIGTALADDPLLTARGVSPARPLLRVVLDRSLRLPRDSRLVLSADRDAAPVLILTSRDAFARYDAQSPASFGGAPGVRVLPIEDDAAGGGLSLPAVLGELGTRGATHVLFEPGPTLAAGLFRSGVADRLWVVQSSRTAPDADVSAPGVPADFVESGRLALGADVVVEHLSTGGPVFFARTPSADLVLTAEPVTGSGTD